MVKVQRFFSLTSFIIVFITAALLILFFRQVTLHWVLHLAETSHQAVAQTALKSIVPELAGRLGDEVGSEAGTGLPAELAENLRRMTHETTLKRIDIHDHNGMLIFSTDPAAVGNNQERDPDLQAALGGLVSSADAYPDIFSRFDDAATTDKLMQTHIPIRGGSARAVLGVFTVHSDISHLMEESDRILLFVLLGAEFILAILYGVLLLVARHAKRVIDTQHSSIRERTTSLEVFSMHLLKKEELRKKQIATDLHEGLAQTLSAIKVNVESSELIKTNGEHSHPLAALVPVLQHAIHEVRSIASDLRPASLDDLGLLPTINWFCREFETRHPQIRIQREISLPEGKIPPRLKVDIYRIVESAFKNIAEHSNTDHIRFALQLVDGTIHLIIGDSATRQHPIPPVARLIPSADPQLRFAETKERTSLSGGIFTARQELPCWVTLCASWTCVE
ncbi:MAG TPA: histidine kinase [Gallionella sp.]